MTKIVQEGDSVLRQTARDIAPGDIASPKIQSLIKRMKEALAGEPRGVALAAPQIGESVRLFIVSNAVFAGENDKETQPLVFINPELIETSPEKEWMEEGCLSCGSLHGEVERHTTVRVRALNKDGKEIAMDGTGLLAQIFQHEIDHLNGILFLDKGRNIQEQNTENSKS